MSPARHRCKCLRGRLQLCWRTMALMIYFVAANCSKAEVEVHPEASPWGRGKLGRNTCELRCAHGLFIAQAEAA